MITSFARTSANRRQIPYVRTKRLLSIPNPQRRRFSTPARSLSIARGQNEKEILQSLKPLLRDAGGRWSITSNGRGIQANFHFKTFRKTWVSYFPSVCVMYLVMGTLHCNINGLATHITAEQEFMCTVASQCEVECHHPEWTNVRVTIMAIGKRKRRLTRRADL